MTAAMTIAIEEESKTLNIWVVEDNASYRKSIGLILDATEDLVLTATFENCEQLLKKHTEFSETEYPDVLMLDITFNSNTKRAKMSGIEGIKKIRACLPHTPIVMLTDHDSSEYIFTALRQGDSGYLNKSAKMNVILDAIRMTSRGGMIIPPTVATRMLGAFQSIDTSSEDSLTPRELQIVELMAEGKSRKAIADALFISPNTVDSHLNKIYQKLHVSTGMEAMAKIYGARFPKTPPQ